MMRRAMPQTIGDLRAWVDRVELHCPRCGRHGRMRVATLIERYGEATTIGDLLRALPGDCPRLKADRLEDRCNVGMLDLVQISVAVHGPIGGMAAALASQDDADRGAPLWRKVMP